MSLKSLSLVGALAMASPAYAITLNMTDFTFGTPVDAVMSGSSGSPSYSGAAGAFQGEELSSGLAAASSERFAFATASSSTSFVAWCAELTQTFSFGVNYDYSQLPGGAYFGTQKVTDLSRLFTAAQGFVVDNRTSAAMQAGIWEIIYEQGPSFSLTGGTFRGAAEDPSNQSAFDTVNGFLLNLASYHADYQIEVLANGEHQDFLVATIPEPGTWALFGAGLGVIGLLRRRRAR
jgi:hypothetical protein